MEQQFPVTQGILVKDVAVIILADVNIHQPGLAVFNLGKAILEVDPVGADRLNLSSG